MEPHENTTRRVDRRRGARTVGGIRITVGYRHDMRDLPSGWLDWMPEVREAAIASALRDYLASAEDSLPECERRHGVPAEFLAMRLGRGGARHPSIMAIPEAVRLARCALEIRRSGCSAQASSCRWGVDAARAAAECAALANPLTLSRTMSMLRAHA